MALCAASACVVERPSADAFAELRSTVEAQLTARYVAAQSGHESFPGATLAFGLADGRVASVSVGFDDVELERPMRLDSRMPSGSVGKTFVATVALGMVADGTLALDGKIAHWLSDEPWFERLPNAGSITLRQLLNHSSGIGDHVFDTDSGFRDYARKEFSTASAGANIEPRNLVRFVLDKEPLFAAGEGFHYSDTGYLLVGMVIEKASGASYYDELTRRVLLPLGLDHTSPLNRRAIAGIAQGYAPQGQRLFGLPRRLVREGELVFDPSLEWTGGGLVTTSSDLVRWALALFNGAAVDDAQLAQMLDSIAVKQHEPGRGYGYGLGIGVVRTSSGVAYRHGGFFPGYSSMLAYFPAAGVAVAMQINADDAAIEEHFAALASTIVARVHSGAVDQGGRR